MLGNKTREIGNAKKLHTQDFRLYALSSKESLMTLKLKSKKVT